MKQQLLKYISENKLIESGEKVLIALSGGPDSVALLHLLVSIRKKLKLTLGAVYLDHQLRSESKTEVNFCRQLCKELKIDFHTDSTNINQVAKQTGKSVETAGRDFRFEKFEQLAQEFKYDKVALGHHADDQVETVLFRLIRGTGRTGLAGIRAKRGIYIRPLLSIRKQQILDYLKENNLKYCLDQSNQDESYRRNYIRHQLLPLIRKELNSDVDLALLNLAETVGVEDAYLEEQTTIAARKVVKRTFGGKIQLDLKPFNNYSLWLQRRLVRHCLALLSANSLAPDKEVVSRFIEFLKLGKKAISLPDKVQAQLAGQFVFLYHKREKRVNMQLNESGRTNLEWPLLSFSCRQVQKLPEIKHERESQMIIVDAKKVKLPLVVRSIETGDRFQPLGMKGSKKIGDYLTDKKVTTCLRDEVLVLCDKVGIIWLVGFEIDERVKIEKSSKEALRIEYHKRKAR